MTDSKSGPGVRLVAAAACVAGPGTAALHETGILSLGPAATLWPIGFIVIAALAGCYTGLRITSRVSKGLGALVAIPNR
jgi:hypothetical protein